MKWGELHRVPDLLRRNSSLSVSNKGGHFHYRIDMEPAILLQITMLPEFPNARRRMTEMWSAALNEGMLDDPLFADIPVRVQKEGNRARSGDSEMNYVKISAHQSFPARVAEGMSVAEFYDAARAMGREMGEQRAKHLFDKLREPSAAAQSATLNENTTFDDILAKWEKMEVRFVGGMPHWPSIVSSPEGVDLVRSLIEDAQENPASREKWRVLIEKKKREFDEREARRRLVD